MNIIRILTNITTLIGAMESVVTMWFHVYHASLKVIHNVLKTILASIKGIFAVKDMPLVMFNIIEETDDFILIIVAILSLLINHFLK